MKKLAFVFLFVLLVFTIMLPVEKAEASSYLPVPEVIVDPSNWTNEEVSITINSNRSTILGWTEYRITKEDEKPSLRWNTYFRSFNFDEEGTYYIEARNRYSLFTTSKVSEPVAIKIDKTAPTSPTVKTSAKDWTNKSVEVRIIHGKDEEGGSGRVKTEYHLGDENWKRYSRSFKIHSDGETTIYARTVDNAGNESEATSTTVKIDKVKPQGPEFIGVPDTEWTNQAVSITLGAKRVDPSGLKENQYKINDEHHWNVMDEPIQLSAEGEYTIKARSLDNAGNIGRSSEVTIKIDTTPPLAPALISSPLWSNEPVRVTVIGGIDINNGSGVERREYRIGQGGEWQTIESNSILIDQVGEHVIYSRSWDRAGNVTPSLLYGRSIVRFDPNPPAITLDLTTEDEEVYEASTWTNQNVTIDASFDKGDGSSILTTAYKIDNGIWRNYRDPFTISKEGITEVSIRVRDVAGNIHIETREIKIDKIAPTAPEVYSTKKWTNEDVTITLLSDGIDNLSGISHVEYRLVGEKGAWITFEDSLIVDLEGVTKVYFRSVDHAGNVSKSTSIVTRIDKQAPVITRLQLSHEDWTSEDVTVTITAKDNRRASGIDYYQYRLNQGEWVTITDTSFVIDQEGQFEIEVKVFDKAGNESLIAEATAYIDYYIIEVGGEKEVRPNSLYTVKNSPITVQMPADLPVGTIVKAEEKQVDETQLEGLNKAGDVITFTFEFPGDERPEGEYVLTLSYQEGMETHVIAIYYFNEDTQEWEYRGGTVDEENRTISLVVPHFSSYGVFFDSTPATVDLSVLSISYEEVIFDLFMNDASGISEAELRRNGEVLEYLHGNETSYTDSTVEAGQTYTYVLWVKDNLGNETEFELIVEVPAAPIELDNPPLEEETPPVVEVETPPTEEVPPTTPEVETEDPKDMEKEIDGEKLPATSTSIYNVLFIGMACMIIALFFIRRRIA